MRLIALLVAVVACLVGAAWLNGRDLVERELASDTEHDGTRWTFVTDSNRDFTVSPPRWGTYSGGKVQ